MSGPARLLAALPSALLVACGSVDEESAYSDAAGLALRQLEARGVRANPWRAGRSLTMSRHGIVASSHVLASQAGLDVLRAGGTAMDAAVASAAVLNVVEPMSTGIGGDVFLLYWDAASKQVYGLNGSGRSPRALPREHFSGDEMPQSGWDSVTVPGTVDAWATGLARFGTRPLAELLAPAIRYAEEGFPVAQVVAYQWAEAEADLRGDPWTAKHYLRDGRAPAEASVFALPALGASLRAVAEGGPDAFYRGPIAREIVRYARESGGTLAPEDFADHRSAWVEPIHLNYRGYEVYQIPPNGQGLGVLLMLNILEGYDLVAMGHNTPEYLHHLVEAKKLAYADLATYVADPEHAEIPLAFLLSGTYGKDRRARIDADEAASDPAPIALPAGSDTVYLATLDRYGNACSYINSVYSAFGSKITGGATGIVLQNRGAGFSLEPGHRNEYAPGKRPYHTIIPGMVLKDGALYMAYGLMGGLMQPQGHVQFLLAHLEFGLDIQQAIDVPRWYHHQGRILLMEHGTPAETRSALRSRGHWVFPSGPRQFGGAQAAMVHPQTGVYLGASDPRKDGAALGY